MARRSQFSCLATVPTFPTIGRSFLAYGANVSNDSMHKDLAYGAVSNDSSIEGRHAHYANGQEFTYVRYANEQEFTYVRYASAITST